MSKAKYVIFILLFANLVVYAVDTIRVTIPDTTVPGMSYSNQEIQILDNELFFINKDNDTSIIGDFFSGFYHDSAYGRFSMNSLGDDRVRVSNTGVNNCDNNTTHQGYKLEGFSFNPEFGAINFNFNSSTYTYVCIPKDELSEELAYMGGIAYSEMIGAQSFDGVSFDSFVDDGEEHSSLGRYVKIEGIVMSENYTDIDSALSSEVRVIGNIQKATLKKSLKQNVYTYIKNINNPNNGSRQVTSLGGETWSNVGGGELLLNGTILYFGDLKGNSVRINGSSDIEGVKTLVVEGGDIIIDGDIRNTDNGDDILGIIALSKDNQGGNIQIRSSVTDIHANMYADRSVVSLVGSNIANGNTLDSDLANQLYIYGSIFSENTIGGAVGLFSCPYYENNFCSETLAKKYDLAFLRRYRLVTELAPDGSNTGNMLPNYEGQESFMGDNDRTNNNEESPGYRLYPLVIEYNPVIQSNAPPFF